MLIALIGGRIVPSFTRNWLAKRKAVALPRPKSGWPDPCTNLGHRRDGPGSVGCGAWRRSGARPAWPRSWTPPRIGDRLARWRGLSTICASPWTGCCTWATAGWWPASTLLTVASLGGPTPPVPGRTGYRSAIGTMIIAARSRHARPHRAALRRAPAPDLPAGPEAAVLRVASAVAPRAGMTILVLGGTHWIAAFGSSSSSTGPYWSPGATARPANQSAP